MKEKILAHRKQFLIGVSLNELKEQKRVEIY